MKYAIIDGSRVTKSGTIYELFPNTSFPKSGVPASFISDNNLLEITEWINTTKPDEKLIQNVEPYVLEGVAYNCKKETCSETEKNAAIASQWENIREERNELLKETDWRASSDLTLSDAWRAYRANLRSIPQSQADPFNITWPNTPS